MSDIMMNISDRTQELFSSLECDPVKYFEETLAAALSDPAYRREDRLYDIRSGLSYYADSMDQDKTDSRKELLEAIEKVKLKSKICQRAGLERDIIVMILTDFHNTWPSAARAIVNDTPAIVSHLVNYVGPLAKEKYEKAVSQAFALGFIEDADIQIIKDADLSQVALKRFYQITKRADIRSLLSNEHKREVASTDLGL